MGISSYNARFLGKVVSMSIHLPFILSCVSLILGPLCCRAFVQSQHLLKMLDGFVFVTIGGLVFTHMLPELIYEAGLLSLLYVACGALGPTFIEKIFRRHSHTTHNLTVILGVLGLILHTLTDGSALTMTANSGNIFLAIGIIVHRFPEGLAVWWMVKPSLGTRWAVFYIILMVCGSTVGYVKGDLFLETFHIENNLLQAFVSGWILHVLFHQPHAKHAVESNSELEFHTGLGALLGIGMLLIMFGVHNATDSIHHSDSHAHLHHPYDHAHDTPPESHVNHAGHKHISGSHQLLDWSLKLAPWLLVLYLLTIMRQYSGLLKPAKNLYLGWFLRLLGPEGIFLSLMLLGAKMALYQLAGITLLTLWLGFLKVSRYTVPNMSTVLKKQLLWASVERSAPWVVFSLIITNLIGHPQGLLEHPLLQAMLISCLLLPLRTCYIGANILGITLAWSGWSIPAIMLPLIAAPLIHIKQIQNMSVRQTVTSLSLVIGIITWIHQQGEPWVQIDHMPTAVEWFSIGILCLAYGYVILISGPRKFVKNLFCIEILRPHKHH